MEEKVLKNGNGNLWKGSRPIHGKLFLTNQKLHHRPNLTAMHRKERNVMLSEIKAVEIGNTMAYGFIPLPNELKVILYDGEELKYIVNRRRKWQEAIEQAVKEYAVDADNTPH